ncbi:MAG: GC-type dockerin domain-anchored protein [Phycisphaerales bacterium]
MAGVVAASWRRRGYGEPDGVLNAEDFSYYLALFAAGC